jgi:hypothetical protein
MTTHETADSLVISRWRRSAATGILVLAAVGALYAFVVAVPIVRAAGPDTVVVESWRLFGFLVFAGLFLLLAYRPNHYPGVWEVVIFHKAALAIFLAAFGADAVDGTAVAVTDGALAVALVVAYLLVKGYRNWDQLREPAA